jgi:NDMA-dependent alcohol dehydrogenase
MKARAAIFWEIGKDWSVEEIDLEPPKRGEVLVRIAGAGLCHSDDHLLTGDIAMPPPIIGGHEGAGIVEEIGEGVTSLAPGDEVIFSFVPSCGRCPSCVSGHTNGCDRGAETPFGRQLLDGGTRHHCGDVELGLMCNVGSFASHTVVNEASCIRVEHPNLSLVSIGLLSCGVVTGWGSAVYAGNVRAGDDVAVVGLGGVGMSAVQGARMAGALRVFAIDPVPYKRERAHEFGATHTAASIEEATELIRDETWGRLCSTVIMAMGVGSGSAVGDAMRITSKRGRVVMTNVHPGTATEVTVHPQEMFRMERQLIGTLYGSANPRYDINRLLRFYLEGHLKLDELVTRTYPLEDINVGYADVHAGRVLRGVITP